jgi:hypothetical protein
MKGTFHSEPLKIEIADAIAEFLSNETFRLVNNTNTLKNPKDDTFPSVMASRMLMPLIANDACGCISVGGLIKSNVKQVWRDDEVKERVGHGLQAWSRLLDL